MFDKMRRKIDFSGYVFILPAMVFFLTFVLYPMIKGVYMSLFRFRGRNESFVGIQNYINLMSDCCNRSADCCYFVLISRN